MAQRHYHVFLGIGDGYVPNCVGTFDTLTEARDALREEKEAFSDYAAGFTDTNLRVRGSIRSGYVKMVDISPMSTFIRTAYIEPCVESDCELGDEW